MTRLSQILPILAGLALAASITTAAKAADMPKAFVGNWCIAKSDGDLVYKRSSKCANPLRERLTIRSDGFIDHDGTCRLIDRASDSMSFQCTNGEEKWSISYRMSMDNGKLRLASFSLVNASFECDGFNSGPPEATDRDPVVSTSINIDDNPKHSMSRIGRLLETRIPAASNTATSASVRPQR